MPKTFGLLRARRRACAGRGKEKVGRDPLWEERFKPFHGVRMHKTGWRKFGGSGVCVWPGGEFPGCG